MTKSFACAVGLFAVVAVDGVASAQAVEWKVSDGGNGHWYQAVPAATYFTWSAADAEARAKGGYLATITDASEANFVRSLINSTSGVVRNLSGTTVGPWIGAVKDPTTLQFGWCTGEPWSYTEWAPGEPTGASWEDRICYYGGALRWNDRPGEYSGNTATPSYVLEWSADCNGDGIVDFGQIRRGELPDCNENNIPDSCEHVFECVSVIDGPIIRPSTGSAYYLLSQSSWAAAEALAVQLHGHLATVNDLEENNFIVSTFEDKARSALGEGSKPSLWIGLSDEAEEGKYVWADGSSLGFTNYASGQPAGGIDDEDYIGIFIGSGDWHGKWHDIVRDRRLDDRCYGVVEVTSPALQVPGQYSTIQAAIDAADIGQTVAVSPGTYNEAIDLKGKAITVKAVGARANTIIDGTGKTTSVVRAVTGETSATVLQGFTIRNGTTGTTPSFDSTLRLGGGMYIDHASPTVRDCAFVSNRAGFGGGLYSLYGNPLIEGCTFSQNVATTDGGGLQLFGGSAVVRNCGFADNSATVRGGGLHVVQYSDGGAPTIDGCTITGNRADVGEGGGMTVEPYLGASAKPVVSNCTIQSNTSYGRGGGLWGLVAPTAPGPNMRLLNNVICNNTSTISKRENVWALYEDGGNAICDCFSDIDGNRGVDNGDIAFTLLFIGELTDPDFIQPDQDMNGFVDTGDLALVLLNFGQCP